MSTLTTEQFIKILDDKLEEKFDKKITPLSHAIVDLKSKVENVMENITFLNAKYDELYLKYEASQKESKLISEENKILKKSIQHLERTTTSLEQAHNDLEQYGRRECIEISGIPAPGPGQSENLNAVVGEVGKLIGVQVKQEDISVCHRLPQPKGYKSKRNEPRIIVKFARRDVKDNFYKARGKLRSKTTKDIGYHAQNNIYLAESLTERNKALFRSCLNVKRDKSYKFIWTLNGTIYLRKDENSDAIKIKSTEDLPKTLSFNG